MAKRVEGKTATFKELRRARSDLGKAAATKGREDKNAARLINQAKKAVERDIEKLLNKTVEVGSFSKKAKATPSGPGLKKVPGKDLVVTPGTDVARRARVPGKEVAIRGPGKEIDIIRGKELDTPRVSTIYGPEEAGKETRETFKVEFKNIRAKEAYQKSG